MNIDAIILAGGMGTRLRTVVADRPKVLATVKDRPFLTRLLDQLAAAGIESVVLSTGYMADQIESAIGETYAGLRIHYSREDQPLGTAGGLRRALDKTSSDPVFALNGDSSCAVDFNRLYQFHCAKKARATILLTQMEDTSRFGRVEADDEGAVREFEEKGGGNSPGLDKRGRLLPGPKRPRKRAGGESALPGTRCFSRSNWGGALGLSGRGRFY